MCYLLNYCVNKEETRAGSSGGPEALVMGRLMDQSAGSRAGIISEKRCSGRVSELTNADRNNVEPALNKLAPEDRRSVLISADRNNKGPTLNKLASGSVTAPAETGPHWE
jgi:hypothetical protein